ncbi:MAG: hypothetical protein J7501_00085 [Bdellovibrio sp.]|nr:hypothetical protein [Bdellovibrio sp.]
MKMVKNFILVVPAAMTLAACNGWDKSPSSDLETLRAQAKVVTQMGPDKPREIIKTVVTTKTDTKTVEEKTVDASFLNIVNEPVMAFSEGKAATYKFRAFTTIPGAVVKLTAKGATEQLPEGLSIQLSKTEKDVYVVSWTPALYTVKAESRLIKVNLVLSVVNPGQAPNPEAVKGLTAESSIVLLVTKTQQAPSNVKVEGLKSEINEGTLTPFTVTVTVPGIDGKAVQKPVINASFDGVSVTAGNSFQELDGSRHIIADLNKKDPEYLGDSKWKYSLIFDTKNISVQPQLAKDGSIMKSADGTRVRFVVKVNNNGLEASSLVQTKIRYNKSIAAPRFDLSGIAKQALEISAGESVSLKFFALSADKNAVVKVETKNSALAGNPQVTCADSATGSSKQDCTLTWTAPCDATAEQLTGAVEMTATSTVDGRISEVTSYSLKTVKAAADKGLCQEAAKTEAK